MTAHLPDSVARDFLRAWRRKRLRSMVIWFPVIFVIVWVGLVGLLLWRGHGLLHLLGKFFGTERMWMLALLASVPVASTGAVLVCYLLIRDCRVVMVPYCGVCHRAQHSLAEICDACGRDLVEKRSYVYIPYDDEKEIAGFFGLQDENA